MPVRLAKILALVAAVQILGGHWFALQSAAWFGMVANYSQQGSLVEALAKTFDGRHPCVLCQTVKSGQEKERKQGVEKAAQKFEAVLEAAVMVPAPREVAWAYPAEGRRADARSLAPPTPPPLV